MLKKAVNEEVTEIERNFKGTIKQHAMATVTDRASDDSEEGENEIEEDKDELQNKPVQREKKKTQAEINKKVSQLLANQFIR